MSDHHGTIHWTELATRDIEGAERYFGALCGWTFDKMIAADGGTYTIAMQGDRAVCGLFDMTDVPQMAGLPAHWSTYIAVDDVDAAVAATRASGGRVLRNPWDVAQVGRCAIVADPGGAAVGLVTPVRETAG